MRYIVADSEEFTDHGTNRVFCRQKNTENPYNQGMSGIREIPNESLYQTAYFFLGR